MPPTPAGRYLRVKWQVSEHASGRPCACSQGGVSPLPLPFTGSSPHPHLHCAGVDCLLPFFLESQVEGETCASGLLSPVFMLEVPPERDFTVIHTLMF